MLTKLKARVTYFVEGVWLPIAGNLSGLHHLIRGHKVRWFKDPDLWNAHLGWIYCTHCPDCEKPETDLVIWGFYLHRVHKLLQSICGLSGHQEAREAMAARRDNDDDDDPIFDQPTGHWYCSRCIADLPTPTHTGPEI